MLPVWKLSLLPPLSSLSSSAAAAENESFAVSERSHQTILHKDEKIDHLSRQLQQAEASRDALLEEVSYLSSKVSSFEEGQSSLKPLRAEISKLKEQNETLLILLGEKEEELEGLMQDMKEIKELYREELNRLLEKSVAC
jgi:chromosome segregation ATPase